MTDNKKELIGKLKACGLDGPEETIAEIATALADEGVAVLPKNHKSLTEDSLREMLREAIDKRRDEKYRRVRDIRIELERAEAEYKGYLSGATDAIFAVLDALQCVQGEERVDVR